MNIKKMAAKIKCWLGFHKLSNFDKFCSRSAGLVFLHCRACNKELRFKHGKRTKKRSN